MKQVETISINGLLTDIENDAYIELSAYLESIGVYFENEQNGGEIIADIEARIAELFGERKNGANRAVTLDDVRYVINTLGSIEDITESDGETQKPNFPTGRSKKTKRLYRNPDKKIIAGVCSGIAARLDLDPVIVRLAFIVFSCGASLMFNIRHLIIFDPWFSNSFIMTSILFYAVLWIIIPMAKTTSQKLEMQGEAINIDNITKNVKKNISQTFGNPSRKSEKTGNSTGALYEIARRIVGIILGIIFCKAGIVILFSLICFMFVQNFVFPLKISRIDNGRWIESFDFFSLNDFVMQIVSPASYTILICCIVIFFSLLISACFFWGIKLIAGFKIKHRKIHVILLLIWFVCIPVSLIVCLNEARNYKSYNEINEIVNLPFSDTVRLSSLSQIKIPYNFQGIYYDNGKKCFYDKPRLSIHKSTDNTLRLEIRKKSQGKDIFEAYGNAEKTDYKIDISEKPLTLSFPPYFSVSPQNEWKFQRVSILLYLPENTHIVKDNFFDENYIRPDRY